MYLLVVAVAAAWFWAGWYFRARLAVRRGESTARAEREAAIRACAKRHQEACIVYQQDQVQEWTGDLEHELKALRKEREKEAAKDAGKSGAHRKRAKPDEEGQL
jgi:hypothetical protein